MTNIFLSFLGTSASISIMVAVLLLLTPFLNKRYAAKWKYLIWIFLALRLLVPFSGADGRLVLDTLSQAKEQAGPGSEEKDTDTQAEARPSGRMIVEIPARMAAPIADGSGKNQAGVTALDLVTFAWQAGSLIFAAVHFVSYFHYKRQVMRGGRRIRDADLLNQMSGLKSELGIRRRIEAVEYDEAGSPMIIGFFKPVLVLPAEQYSLEELFFILKHELVHLKRGDVYFKLLFMAANGVHWFNPFIWIMQREAAVDMELSCDERVTQGASYAVRKAYTETLLSMLHKGCVRRTALSTQFYGGTKIMKKRFKNILRKNRKKNGICVFICTVMLTIGFGMLVGCSIAREDTDKGDTGTETIERENREDEGTELAPARPEGEDIQTEHQPGEDSSAGNPALEDTTVLTFSKEGEQEQKQATLAVGAGYSIYLPDDEWRQSDLDIWTAAVNEQVLLWIVHFEDNALDSIGGRLADNGYVTVEDHHMWKQEGDLTYHVSLKEFENDMWGIFYCYPIEAEEGWGRELPVIADTFAISIGADDDRTGGFDSGGGDYLEDEDWAEIRGAAEAFGAAYFGGDISAIRSLLASTYEGEADTYAGAVSDWTVKGLSEGGGKRIESGSCAVSLEFRDSRYEDMLLYVTVVFAREEGSWKIQFYGVEG